MPESEGEGLIASLSYDTPHNLAIGTRLKRIRLGRRKKRKKYDNCIDVRIRAWSNWVSSAGLFS